MPADSAPSVAELDLGRQVGVPESTLRVIHRIIAADLVALHPLDSLGNPLPPRGLAFGLPTAKVRARLTELRSALGVEYLVFEADRGFGYHPDSIAIVPGRDPLDILRVRATNGLNYDIDNDSIVGMVRGWQDSVAFRLEAAGFDWLEGTFGDPPDWDALAAMVYAVCPDVVEQGTGTVPALAAEMRKTGTLYCWWD
jgi:hypothetical protein